MLHERIRVCLRVIFKTLLAHFTCCEQNHVSRLKLDSFADQIKDDASKLAVEMYLSTRQDRKPPEWLRSICAVERYDSGPYSTMCI
jgi:hypothetical protein